MKRVNSEKLKMKKRKHTLVPKPLLGNAEITHPTAKAAPLLIEGDGLGQGDNNYREAVCKIRSRD